MLKEIKLKFDVYEDNFGLYTREVVWLIEQAERVENLTMQLREIILTIYEHANEGTELMEIAEKIDGME